MLGFKKKFSKLSTKEKRDEYSGVIKAIKSACHSFQDHGTQPVTYNLKRSHFYWFSDTFILFSEEFSSETLNIKGEELIFDFFHSAKMSFLRFLHLGFPLRGGIDYGEFIADPERNIFLGQALINSYRMSEKHKWAGISLTPECSKFVKKYKKLDDMFIDYNVPTKWNKPKQLKVIDWPNDRSIIHRSEEPDEYVRNQFLQYCTTTDGRVEGYLKNTIDFLNKRLQENRNCNKRLSLDYRW
ncbi:MAG: hypothetical protein Q7I93_00725, partial [Syntrophales bacterium]|nr:hypothetical protein [Syntrophales bacterium]